MGAYKSIISYFGKDCKRGREYFGREGKWQFIGLMPDKLQ
jgi:hypothetical protein